ncbi:hypothetical protein Tco_0013015 [Tanacetum coccineum]
MFEELISTPIDFSLFVMNNIKIENLTQEILVGPAYDLLKGTCKSFMELEYHFEEVYKVMNDQLDWINPEGHEYPIDLSKPLPLIQINRVTHIEVDKRYDYGYLKEIVVRREDRQLYKFKEGDFPRLNLNKLMRLDELYKFCDGTLNSVRSLLHDIANNLRMEYLAKRDWSRLDRTRSRIMIKMIDELLFERRLMTNLERFVGDREYENDFRLLERTI